MTLLILVELFLPIRNGQHPGDVYKKITPKKLYIWQKGKDAFMLQNTFGLTYEIFDNILLIFKIFTINKEKFNVKMKSLRNISRSKNS